MRVNMYTPELAVLRPREPEGDRPWGYVQLQPPGPGLQALQLRIMYRLGLNPAGFLSVQTSSFGVMVDPDSKGRCFLRIEFDRDKGGRLPEAHLQVDADSTLWGWALAWSGQGHKDLQELHFPCGGRRFRPTLEDLIDFLIRERLTVGLKDWATVVDRHRARFGDLQARATVRRQPEVAAEVLADLGYTVIPPDT